MRQAAWRRRRSEQCGSATKASSLAEISASACAASCQTDKPRSRPSVRRDRHLSQGIDQSLELAPRACVADRVRSWRRSCSAASEAAPLSSAPKDNRLRACSRQHEAARVRAFAGREISGARRACFPLWSPGQSCDPRNTRLLLFYSCLAPASIPSGSAGETGAGRSASGASAGWSAGRPC